MKESSVGRIAFGVSVVLTMIFTLISLLTPAWRIFEKKPEALNLGPAVPASIGLFRYQCFGDLGKENGKISKEKRPDIDFCNYIFDNRAPWDASVVYAVISSLAIELIAILYLFLPRAFCCENYEHMAAPFSAFAGTIFVLLLYAVISYAERYSEISSLLKAFSETEGHSGLHPSMIIIDLGYSYYLLCISFVFSFLSLIIGILNVTLAWCFLW
uniref:MARVEL domain-containing protein n=1 Tax=Elaeophora elaphi TaxID=1147741 RepID=A0A0R3S4S4_9BILA